MNICHATDKNIDNSTIISVEGYSKTEKTKTKEVYKITAKNGKQGLSDILSNILVPAVYDEINNYRENIFLLKKSSKYYFYDSEASILKPLPYDNVTPTEFYFIVEKSGKKGVCSSRFDVIAEPIYKDIKIERYHYFILLDNNDKYSFLSGSKPLNPDVTDADEIILTYDIGTGFLVIKKNGKFGVEEYDFQKKGVTRNVLPYEYDSINNCNPINIIVEKDGKFGLADYKTGNIKVDIAYDEIKPLSSDYGTFISGNLFKIRKDGKYAIYDYRKNKISKFKYDDVKIVKKDINSDYYLVVKENGKNHYTKTSRIKLIAKKTGEAAQTTIAILTLPITIIPLSFFTYCLYKEFNP